jgi:hypothetical protein
MTSEIETSVDRLASSGVTARVESQREPVLGDARYECASGR